MKRLAIAVAAFLTFETSAFGSGILVPKEAGLPPLAVKYHRVDVNIRDQVAETRVEQVFTNNTDRQLEAVFIFPLPEKAAITEFAMMINGKRVSGELLEKEKARGVYEDIVRKMRDPGLLEYMGSNLLKARVFPIPPRGDQKIEVEYSEVLPYDGGVVRYLYPLKTGEKASATLEDFSMAVHVASKESIKSVYSPSHEVGVSRPADHEAVVGFEEDRAALDRDFALYYTVSEREVGINMIPYRQESEDGYFLLLVTPGSEVKENELVSRDITFVLDTSGSMAERNKIEQAKNALKQCLKSLPERDRFNIVRFSTDVDTFAKELVNVSSEKVAEAVKYVDQMEARGGTQIHDALLRALTFGTEKDRPYTIVFLTDGKPTVGITDKDAILNAVKDRNRIGARIFVFGVGPQVNTHLLDLVSGQNGGVSEYVKPEEEIEAKVSMLYHKMSNPVLANPELTFSNIDVYDLYPQKLSDLFAGLQVTLFGRYRKAGDAAVTLRGMVNGKEKSFVYETTFPEKNRDHSFIPRLWATRKVGYLLDEIRLHGENPELREEVVRLSKEHGVMTPYTSYLVTEDKLQTAMAAPMRGAPPGHVEHFLTGQRHGVQPGVSAFQLGQVEGRELRAGTSSAGRAREENELVYRERPGVVWEAVPGDQDDMQGQLSATGHYGWYEGDVARTDSYARAAGEESGAEAVLLAKKLRTMKDAAETRSQANELKHVEGRTFIKLGPTWVDQEFLEAKSPKLVAIKYASDAYFALVNAEKVLAKFFALGERVIVKHRGVFIHVGDEGRDTLTPEEMKDLFRSGS